MKFLLVCLISAISLISTASFAQSKQIGKSILGSFYGLGEIGTGVLIAGGGVFTGPGEVLAAPVGYTIVAKGVGDVGVNAVKLYLVKKGHENEELQSDSIVGYLFEKGGQIFFQNPKYQREMLVDGDLLDALINAGMILEFFPALGVSKLYAKIAGRTIGIVAILDRLAGGASDSDNGSSKNVSQGKIDFDGTSLKKQLAGDANGTTDAAALAIR